VIEQRSLRADRMRDFGFGPAAGLRALLAHDVGVPADDHDGLRKSVARHLGRVPRVHHEAGAKPLVATARLGADIAAKRHAEDADLGKIEPAGQRRVVPLDLFELVEHEPQVVRQKGNYPTRQRHAVHFRRLICCLR
jgi:hypothetical protein